MIKKILIGDILKSKMSVLVNTVNSVGVMGKGIALDFKKKYPDMFFEYSKMCDKNMISPGHIYPYYDNGKVIIINFATKMHWHNPSKISYIENGLKQFVQEYVKLGITSVAFPPLGCGNGGLEWKYVGPLMYRYLSKLDIDVEIYAPNGTPKEQLTESFLSRDILFYDIQKNNNLNVRKNWFLALYMVDLLNKSKYNIVVGRTFFQKIFYVMHVSGIDMGISFTKGYYGPYSKDINKIIAYFSNNNYLVEESIGKMFRIRITGKYKFSKENYSINVLKQFDYAFDLLSRMKNTDQAELVTSIIYSYFDLLKNKSIIYEKDIIMYLLKWKHKYDNSIDKMNISEICKYLSLHQYIGLSYNI